MTSAMAGPSRRAVLGGLAAVALGVAIGVSPTAAAAGRSPAISRSTFAGSVGARLTVSGHGVRMVAVLDKIDDLIGAPTGHQAAFSITLRRLSGSAPAQETYTVRLPRGDVPLFLVPVGADADRRYQAIINQIRYSTAGVPL